MKFKMFLVTVVCSIGVLTTYAQKGVDNGTRFGTGADSVRCIENISLFTSYAKTRDFKSAFDFWKIAYQECPASTKDIYLYGVRIIGWMIDNEKDPAKKEALIKDLLAVYDQRIKYFGNDKKYGKDWIIGRKVQDYMGRMGEKADSKLMYSWLEEAINEYDKDTDALAVSLYMFASRQLFTDDPNHKEKYIQDYLKSAAILDTQLKAAEAAGNAKDVTMVSTLKKSVDDGFANSGAADCETLQGIYAGKVEENKENLPYLKEVITLLRRLRCQEIDVYFAASGYAYKMEPTSESALGLGKQAIKQKDYETAVKFFEEAANLETDASVKSDDYYMISLISFEQNNYVKARQYCLKAIETNPNTGAPYLLIGKMYAATAKNVYPNDDVMMRAVYFAAVDKFEKAKQVDPSCAEEANTLISQYRKHFPSTEDVFMHPELEKGKSVSIGGWIGERTTVR